LNYGFQVHLGLYDEHNMQLRPYRGLEMLQLRFPRILQGLFWATQNNFSNPTPIGLTTRISSSPSTNMI